MTKHFYFFIFLLCISKLQAQFEFSGTVSKDFINSTVYLTSIDDYNKSTLFLTEQIIQESEIDSSGNFIFKGDFLSKKNKFYKIYIDKCNESVTDYNHLLNHCDDSNFIIFIANNSDKIHFPLNSFSQMFCDLKYSRKQNIAIHQIDSIQEILLTPLLYSKSDTQRKIIYNNYFEKLQKYSQTFDEPLAELYAYHIYSDTKSFSRSYYLDDLKTSDYYTNLLKKLKSKYPKSQYTKQFKEDLKRDSINFKENTFDITTILLGSLLALSLFVNFILIRKKKKKKITVDYKTILSPQEQKVFELMQEKLANKEIADQLFISLSTVKTHINNIYSKLSISSRKDIHQFF
ncbi:MAG: helix-turn-helix transcriptional regulator [Flavobacteriaceae bacterium]|nr:helix-turn-helix transcriptional regulator [Flavobacteriaceae bacterium]